MTEREEVNEFICEHRKIILFGASRTGKECFELIDDKNRKKICGFTDNDITRGEDCQIFSFFSVADTIKSEAEILITSVEWKEIYGQLLDNVEENRIIGIFANNCLVDFSELYNRGLSKKEILEYASWLEKDKRKILYVNEAHINMEKKMHKEIERRIDQIIKTQDLYSNLWEVNIELSNLCNYSIIHTKCPVHKAEKKQILSSDTVYKIIDELAEMNFNGILRFGTYNEVLIDPRLFKFIEYAKKIKQVLICIYSNGFYLNDVMVEELNTLGIDELTVTAYGDSEWERLRGLNVNIPYRILMCRTPKDLDDRIQLYEKPFNYSSDRCMEDMIFYIDSNEQLRMCCLDWKSEQYKDFGKISSHSIKEWTHNEWYLNNIIELTKGNRKCNLCKRCSWDGWLCSF